MKLSLPKISLPRRALLFSGEKNGPLNASLSGKIYWLRAGPSSPLSPSFDFLEENGKMVNRRRRGERITVISVIGRGLARNKKARLFNGDRSSRWHSFLREREKNEPPLLSFSRTARCQESLRPTMTRPPSDSILPMKQLS